MAGRAAQRAFVAMCVRIMLGADRVAAAQRQPVQRPLGDRTQPGQHRGQPAQRALRARRRGVEQQPEPLPLVIDDRVQPLLQRGRRISAIQRDLVHQRVGKAVHRVIGEGWKAQLVAVSLVRPPPVMSAQQHVAAGRHRRPRQPGPDGVRVEAKEDAFAQLLHGGQPFQLGRQRGALHRQVQFLQIAIDRGRRRLEPGKAVQARHLAQPVHRDRRCDRRQPRPLPVPLIAGQRARMQPRIGRVRADFTRAAGQQVELRHLGCLFQILVSPRAKLRDARDDLRIAPSRQRGAQGRVGAPRHRHFGRHRHPVDRIHMRLDQPGQLVLRGGQRDDGQHLREIGVGRGPRQEAEMFVAFSRLVRAQPGSPPAALAETSVRLRIAQRERGTASAHDPRRGGVARGAALLQP